MALGTYSELQSAVASYLHRSDLTTEIQDAIRLAEADMQVRAKLSQWDTSTTIAMTNGVGALPSDFAQAISVRYGADSYTLEALHGDAFDNLSAASSSGSPTYFSIRGTNLLLAPAATGTVTLEYTARFTPLSTSATTNSLLTLFPDAYLYGTLMHMAVWDSDDASVSKYVGLFEQSVVRIRKYMLDFKYPVVLQMKVA
jgi:hypothetical protein